MLLIEFVFFLLRQQCPEKPIAHRPNAEIVVEEFMVRVVAVCSQKMVTAVATARLHEGQHEPKVSCVWVGVCEHGAKRNASNVAQRVLHRVGEHRGGGARSLPLVMDLVNGGIEFFVVDQTVRPVKPKVYNDRTAQYVQYFTPPVERIFLLRAVVKATNTTGPGTFIGDTQQWRYQNHIECRHAGCVDIIPNGEVFVLDFAGMQPLSQGRRSRENI